MFSFFKDLCGAPTPFYDLFFKGTDSNIAAHLMAKYMGRMANMGKVWTFIMMVMKAM